MCYWFYDLLPSLFGDGWGLYKSSSISPSPSTE